METRSSAKVELVPWDYESAAHCDRIFRQREACGWKSEEVEMWRDKSRNGTKMLYWIILSDDCPGREDYLTSHVTKYPEESAPIIDTAPAAYLQPRHPSRATFTPIGHVALDLRPEENSNVGLPSDAAAVWISALYVSWALQRGGVGGAAMRATEKLAGDENGPLKGELIVLDTVPEEYQFDEALIEQFYYAYGRPKPVISNEMWYRKQGYELFHSVPVGYMWPKNGEMVPVPFLYMKKKLR